MNRSTEVTMVRSLFPFDMTFWRRTVMTLAPAGHSTGGRMDEPETFIIGQRGVVRAIVIRPRDWTRLDSLQVLTKWLNVTLKAVDAHQSDRGAKKG